MDLTTLARVSEELEVEPGSVLCREGEIGQEFFVIVDGKVKVTRKGRRIATRGTGDFVGEIALLEEIPRTATVTASGTVVLRTLAREPFLAAVTGNHLSNEALRRLVEARAQGAVAETV